MVLVSGIIALVFTLALLSYVVTDNPFYRIAAHLFIGLTAGYAVMLTWYNVIWPSLVNLVRLGSLISSTPDRADTGLTVTLTLLAGALGGIGGVLLLLKTTQ